MDTVDLRLAVTYLPVLLCFVKTWAMLAVLAFMASVNDFAFCYTFLFLTLLGDRIITEDYIFDSNGTVFVVLGASIINTLRDVLSLEQRIDGRIYAGLFYAHGNVFVGIVWCLCALAFHLSPLRTNHKLATPPYPSLALSYVCISLSCLLPLSREDTPTTALRATGFVCLCILWVYLLGIQVLASSVPPRRAGAHYMCRFLPVLLAPKWCALAFAIASALGLLYHGVRVHNLSLPQWGLPAASPYEYLPPSSEGHAMPAYERMTEPRAMPDPERAQLGLSTIYEDPRGEHRISHEGAGARDHDGIADGADATANTASDEDLFFLAKSAQQAHRR